MNTNEYRSFNNYCLCGFIKLAQDLYFQHNFPITDELFIAVCERGHVNVAQWLINLKKTFIVNYNTLLKTICINGHFDMIKWLFPIFRGQNLMSIKYITDLVIQSYPTNDLLFTQWLYNELINFQLSDNNNKDINAHLFQYACKIGSLSIVQWLLSIDNELKYDVDAFNFAVRQYRQNVVDLLCYLSPFQYSYTEDDGWMIKTKEETIQIEMKYKTKILLASCLHQYDIHYKFPVLGNEDLLRTIAEFV